MQIAEELSFGFCDAGSCRIHSTFWSDRCRGAIDLDWLSEFFWECFPDTFGSLFQQRRRLMILYWADDSH
jgi:hypothetical protein